MKATEAQKEKQAQTQKTEKKANQLQNETLETNPFLGNSEASVQKKDKNANPFLGEQSKANNPFLVDPVQKKDSEELDNQEVSQAKTNSIQRKSWADQSRSQASPTDGVLQRDTKEVKLPEKLGPAQNGPIAQKGEGDANAFSPNDVNQGSIGDCYFLASLIGVANTNPNLIKNAIKDNGNGSFTVKLYTASEEGAWFWKKKVFTPTNVILYPTFPISVDAKDDANANASSNPAHAHGGDKDAKGNTELWVRLVEKAYALMLGSYKKLGSGGFGADALEVLTGKPYKEEVLGKSSKERIIEMYKNKQPIELGTTKTMINALTGDLKKFAMENSIVGGHAYAVMYADESKIRVRNPWGKNARNAEPELTWAQFNAFFNQFSNAQ
jgi:Calpain family cysteine protease